MPGHSRKSLNKNKIICAQCKMQILESDDSMQCDACERTLHTLCTKLDKKQVDKLVKDHSLEYKCFFCAPNDVSVASELSEIKTKLNQLSEIKETMQFMSSQYDDILKGVVKNKKKIEMLQKENKNLREEVNNLKSSVKYLNDMRVQNDCVINGVKINENAKAIDVVLDIAKKVGADICENEVEEAFFLNKSKQADSKTSVVVKFSSKKTKKILMDGKSKLKKVDEFQNVYINDFLCKETLQLLNYAKSLKSVGFKFIFAKGGSVFAKKDENARQIRLRSMDDIDNILCKQAGGVAERRRQGGGVAIQNQESSDDELEEDDLLKSPN